MRLLGLLKPFAKRELSAFFALFLLGYRVERIKHACDLTRACLFQPLGFGPKEKPVKCFMLAEVNANDDQ